MFKFVENLVVIVLGLLIGLAGTVVGILLFKLLMVLITNDGVKGLC
jgi:hypothetical protein